MKNKKLKPDKKMNQEDLNTQNKALKKIIKALEKKTKTTDTKENQNNNND